MKKMILSLGALFTLTFSIAEAAPANNTSLLYYEKLIEERISQVVRTADARSMVFVNLRPLTRSQALPFTPFSVKELPVVDAEGNLRFESMNILVVGTLKALSPATEALIRKVIPVLGITPKIEYSEITAEMLEKVQADARAPDSAENSSLAKNLTVQSSVLAALLLALVLIAIGALRRTTGLRKALDAGFSQLGGFARSSEGETTSETARRDFAVAPPKATPSTGESPSRLKEFSTESLTALFSDLYWCEEDTTAAWAWGCLSLDQRRDTLRRFPPMKAYVAHFISLEAAEDPVLLNDPYYLTPLPISLVNNSTLGTLVRKNPGMIHHFSQLRIENLGLSALERLRFAASPPARESFEFEKIPAALDRPLKKTLTLYPASHAEEIELLSQDSLSHNVVSQVRMLGWLTRLTPKSAEEILKGYSARDLATIWDGHPSTLAALEKFLPEKKLHLMKSYLGRIEFDRESPVLAAVHLQIQAALPAEEESRAA